MRRSDHEPIFDPKRYYRLHEIVGDRNASPPVIGPLPIPRSTWYQLISTGLIPEGEYLAPRIVAWRGSVLNAAVKRMHDRSKVARRGGRPKTRNHESRAEA